jgi:hypothetical protein
MLEITIIETGTINVFQFYSISVNYKCFFQEEIDHVYV